jgi:hypothetical protein
VSKYLDNFDMFGERVDAIDKLHGSCRDDSEISTSSASLLEAGSVGSKLKAAHPDHGAGIKILLLGSAIN